MPTQPAADRQVCARTTEVLSRREDAESPRCRQAGVAKLEYAAAFGAQEPTENVTKSIGRTTDNVIPSQRQ
ncbi:hypothetical protein GW7_11725 [Heterocephalus glaber]|uniref:Uncharacterized protein n=1 Tax=Heterocephalus glaber TaxID=10181 RepID=G5C9I1_HETGA|nr:hypothetical protein GW7_11725 [Heterocephalus glaber]